MKDYGKQRGLVSPQPIEITETSVLVATDIQPYTDTINDKIIQGYEYNFVEYSKDEYIDLLIQKEDVNHNKIEQLEEELAAAKILLGVE